MKYLDIDTGVLRTCVGTAKKANDAITEACTRLNQVVIHNDWECDERQQLNENTVANRQKAQEIQDNASSFYDAIEKASAAFDEVEQRTILKVNKVDDLLSQIVSVVPGITGGIGGSPAISSFDNIKDSLEG